MDNATENPKKSGSPLVVDVVVPMGAYYLLKHDGMSTVAALAWSSALPAVRTVWGIVRERRVNGLAALILFVNVVGLALSTLSGDPRLMLVKDSAVSSAVGIGVLISVLLGRPLMSAGLKPWIVKSSRARAAAWERLSAGSRPFRRLESLFSLIWGAALLAECVVRVAAVYSLPVDTMVWFGNVIMGCFVILPMLVGGALAAAPLQRLVAAEAAACTPETAAPAAAPTARTPAGTTTARTPAGPVPVGATATGTQAGVTMAARYANLRTDTGTDTGTRGPGTGTRRTAADAGNAAANAHACAVI
ncbi:VC0807 family protein [Streptomyces sp. NPDC006649]|uniref:VC0807 family protein n=1 Tax=Streptomyces sp. NPDC006649 TaxID=3156896 RepID=UPI0033B94D00